MSSIALLQSALAGLRESRNSYEETGMRIARESLKGDFSNLDRDLVELTIAETGVKANAIVARSADEQVGTLLDILA